jgi:hypothetical protein
VPWKEESVTSWLRCLILALLLPPMAAAASLPAGAASKQIVGAATV